MKDFTFNLSFLSCIFRFFDSLNRRGFLPAVIVFLAIRQGTEITVLRPYTRLPCPASGVELPRSRGMEVCTISFALPAHCLCIWLNHTNFLDFFAMQRAEFLAKSREEKYCFFTLLLYNKNKESEPKFGGIPANL
jgi:hypothetical protein